MANFKGTNIPLSTLDGLKAANRNKYNSLVDRLANAIEQNDSRDVNEVIMSIAYFSMETPDSVAGDRQYGVGHGNANVSKIHSSEWRLDPGKVDDYAPWAVDHNNSSNDVYELHSGIPSGVYMFGPGDIITYDDEKGIGVNGIIVDSWGQRGHTQQGDKWGLDNPHVGKKAAAPTNPVYSGGAGDDDLKRIWPDIDWGGGQGDTDLEQYDYWPTQNIGGGGAGTDLGQYGPTVTKGLFGFSDKDPADLAKPAFNYLNAYGIGSNLAYKPWHSDAWRGPETDKEIADKTTPRTYYGGIPGGTDTRDQLYYYGGSRANQVIRDKEGKAIIDPKTGKAKRGTLLQPMQVPGGWKTATLPEGAQSVYPIARTPLFPSGLLSPEGAVAPYVKPAVDKTGDDKTGDDKTGDDKTGAGAGKKLAFYKGRAGALGGITTSGSNIMFQVTGEPTEKYIGDGKTTWGDMALDLWNAGNRYQTTAHRSMKTPNWTDADNQWYVNLTADMREQGGMSQFNIKFADWAGGVSSNKIYGGTPSLNFLGKPQNLKMRDPDNPAGPMLDVPYALASAGGSEYLDPAALGTTTAQPWGQPAGMRTAGFPTGYGGKWVMPGIYGQERDTGMTTSNLLGYGLPAFLEEQYYGTGADITPAGGWGSVFPGLNPNAPK